MTFCQCQWHLILNRLTTYTVLINHEYVLAIRLLVGNVRVRVCVDRDTLLSLCSLKWRGKSSRNDVERYICVYGYSFGGTRHRQSESDEVVRGRGRRLVRFVLHKDLAGCVVQQKINTDPAWKNNCWFCTILRLIWKHPHKGDSQFVWNL